MATTRDTADTPETRELGELAPRWRRDLRCSPRWTPGDEHVVVEDPLGGRFFRLGPVEHRFASSLDGRTPVRVAVARIAQAHPDAGLTEERAAALCRWIAEMGLFERETCGWGASSDASDSPTAAIAAAATASWNPLVFRVPLGRPDRAFAALAGALGWLGSWPAIAAWCLLLLSGSVTLLSQWGRFELDTRGILARDNWLWLAASWLLLKLLHEGAHGVVCRRVGGTVGEWGLQFVALAPLAYVDVTSTWRLESRWRRMAVAAAGMYVELAVAAAAVLVWSRTASPWIAHRCCDLAAMASVTTLLFNLNPLMKFDGYFLLADAWGVPNLDAQGRRHAWAVARRWVLGEQSPLPAVTASRRRGLACYGWACLGWRAIVAVGLVLTAMTLFHGAGLLLAAIGVALWTRPAMLALRQWAGEQRRSAAGRARLWRVGAVGAALGALTIVTALLPWPGRRVAPAVVEYSPLTVVRAPAASWVRALHVSPGEPVVAGQLLLELAAPELALEAAELRLSIARVELEERRLAHRGELARSQEQAEERAGLLTRLRERETQLERLAVRAPRDGTVIRRGLEQLLGVHVDEGAELLSLGDESSKELRAAVSQQDLESFTRRVGERVRVELPGRRVLAGELEQVEPRALREPPAAALAAPGGGPLAVRPVSRRDDNDSPSPEYELLHPCFTATVALSAEDSAGLRAGELGVCVFRPCDESVVAHLRRGLESWLRHRLGQIGE